MIRALLVPVGAAPKVVELPDGDDPEPMQKLIGGWIEGIALDASGVVLICNEEGMLRDLPFNRVVGRFGWIRGDFLVTRCGRDGETVSLIDADVSLYTEMFQ